MFIDNISSFILCGTVLIVLTLFVISSPTTPSPRVAALLKIPFSYFNETDKPSILSSHTYLGVIPSFLIRESKRTISFGLIYKCKN